MVAPDAGAHVWVYAIGDELVFESGGYPSREAALDAAIIEAWDYGGPHNGPAVVSTGTIAENDSVDDIEDHDVPAEPEEDDA